MRIGIDASRGFVNEPTGTERYSYELITRILALPEAREHEWILYARNLSVNSFQLAFKNCQMPNVKLVNISLPRLWTQVGLAYRTWVDRLDVLWVPAHTLPLLRQPSWLRKGRLLKTVVTIHGIEYEWLPAYENRLQRWYLPLSTQYAVRSAQKIIAVSEFTKKQLVERLGADAGKIEVVYEGAGSNPKPETLNTKLILSKYNLQEKKYLLFVGTVQPRKNLERFIVAYAGLRAPIRQAQGKQDSGLKLVIAGKLGWNYERVVELAKKHGVIITGYITEAERYILLQNAVVYVQPSITEGFGLPVLEAMKVGVPVASSNGGALAEVVGGAGVLFDPYNVSDMSLKLSLVIHSHSLQKELIEKGRKRVKEFGWEKAAKMTYNILTVN